MKKRGFQLKHRLPVVLTSISLMGVLAPAWAVPPALDEESQTRQRFLSWVRQRECDAKVVSQMLGKILTFLDQQKASPTPQTCQHAYDAIWKDPVYKKLKAMLPQNSSALRDLEALPSLKVCDPDERVQEEKLTKKLLSFLPKLDGLKALNLESVNAFQLKHVAPYLPSGLNQLDLQIDDLDQESFQALAQHMPKNLELFSLSLFPAQFQFDDELAQVFVRNLPRELKSLHLFGIGFDDKSAFPFMNNLPKGIEILSFSEANLSDTAINAFAKHSFEDLRDLSLDGNTISPEGAKTLAKALPQSLRSLSLIDNPIGKEGAVAIVKNCPPTLRLLSFSKTGLEDGGALCIADLLLKKDLPLLKGGRVQFHSNPIGDEARAVLENVLERDVARHPDLYFDAVK